MPQIAVFGGSFNPIHCGHLLAAEHIRERCGFDKIIFVPVNTPPHKESHGLAPGFDRLVMASLACSGNPHFEVSETEVRRGGTSYSVDTIRELEKTHGEGLALIVGSDMVPDLSTWKDAQEILDRCRLVVAARPGYDVQKIMRYQMVGAQNLGPAQKIMEKLEVVEFPGMDVSSSEVRRRLAQGESVRYLVPEPVESWIRSRKLYGNQA